jgi:Sugar phosphate isomerases/epimerases
MKYDRKKIYISTIAGDSRDTALKYGFGLEIAEYCTATNMDTIADVPECLTATGLEIGKMPKWDKIVRDKLEGIGRCTFHAPFNELCPAAIEPRIYEVARARYREAAALAGTYGAQRMVVHSGYVPLVYHKGYFHERSVVFWRDLLGDLPQDFTLLLENVLDDTPELLTGIVREIDDPRLRLCLDIGHANTIVSEVPILEWIDICAPYLGHLHLHNNYREYDNHNPPDDGLIDSHAAIRRLLEHNPADMTLTIESIEALPTATWLEAGGYI